MEISIKEAATKLGKSLRQIRYMVDNGDLKARKVRNRWYVIIDDHESDDTPSLADMRKRKQVRDAIENALGVPDEPASKRYSVRDLKAFQIASALYAQVVNGLSVDHAALRALRDAAEHLVRGCHRYDKTYKVAAYAEAREYASVAITELQFSGWDGAYAAITEIEQNLMAAIAGLIRRLERSDQRSSKRAA